MIPQRILGRLRHHTEGTLWHHKDFRSLWCGQAISQVGSAVSLIALPTAAILVFNATPFQVGLLGALQAVPFAGALLVGAVVDRVTRKPLLIAADVGRVLAVGSIPIAAALDIATLAQLYVVAVVLGLCTVVFDVAYYAYLPTLVDREDLLEGNAKLGASESVASSIGPAIGGLMIQLFRATGALLVDALSYLFSVLFLLRIERAEVAPESGSDRGIQSIASDIGDGIRFVWTTLTLRQIAATNMLLDIGVAMCQSVYLIFALRELELSPVAIGAVFSTTGIANLVGVLLIRRLTTRLGFGRAIALSGLTGAASWFLVAGGAIAAPFVFLFAAAALEGLVNPIYDVNQLTLRQSVTPDQLQGRVTATMRTIYWAPRPLGFLVGGAIGSSAGLIPALLLGSAIGTAGSLILWSGSIRKLVKPPSFT